MQGSALVSAGLTCRAWFKICAPTLYREIYVSSSCVSKLITVLSQPGSRIPQHAKELMIRGPVPWRALPRLLALLPRVLYLLQWPVDSPRWNNGRRFPCEDALYHPTLPRIMSGVLAASRTTLSTLTELKLTHQCFSSPADVLRLLALCLSLQSASLLYCFVRSVPEIFPVQPFTRLVAINIETRHATGPAERLFLAQWWQWPHPTIDGTVGAYPGLHHADARSICDVLKCFDTSESFRDIK